MFKHQVIRILGLVGSDPSLKSSDLPVLHRRDFVFDFVGTFNLTNTNDVATAVSSTGRPFSGKGAALGIAEPRK